jgi:hypothetical protein
MLDIITNYLSVLTQLTGSSLYVNGIIMLFLNVGTAFLMQDITPAVQQFFQAKWARRLVFFAIFFTATRHLGTSILLTILSVLLLDFFLNPTSRLYILPRAERRQRRERRFRRNARVIDLPYS